MIFSFSIEFRWVIWMSAAKRMMNVLMTLTISLLELRLATGMCRRCRTIIATLLLSATLIIKRIEATTKKSLNPSSSVLSYWWIVFRIIMLNDALSFVLKGSLLTQQLKFGSTLTKVNVGFIAYILNPLQFCLPDWKWRLVESQEGFLATTKWLTLPKKDPFGLF